MTASLTRTLREASLVLAVAASVSALSSTASFAFTAEAQQMCTSDAFRLCSSEIPNIPKITACMIKHRADLPWNEVVMTGTNRPWRLYFFTLARLPTPICALLAH